LETQKVQTELLTGIEGTETSFKNLSGQNVSIIHLATHGMYITPMEASIQRANNNFLFIRLGDIDIQEDYALTRSFLVMTGGNCLPHRVSIPEMAEDGILTALEISTLDLNGLDLIVLSACQTALGDINKEGVYGLQRAFKKAGANTILMSLDKVDDEATRILMVEFYRNLTNGKTKHQSLHEAQNILRKVDRGKYDDPKYWASFIMLDGLD
jgi:CHAT domain-containing protein